MSKHTPGPWHIQSRRASKVLATKRGDDGGFNIVVADCRRSIDSMSRKEIHANARLIAAAPEMLKALKALIAPDRDFLDQYDNARALIAKIEGDP